MLASTGENQRSTVTLILVGALTMMHGSNSAATLSEGASAASIVYVVDDDESIRVSVHSLLRSVGLRAEKFGSSEEFLAFPKPDLPSCLILDVRLFMTAHGDIEMTVKAMKAGALDFFSKPFRDQDMLDAVANALARDAERIETERSMSGLRACYESLTAREREIMGHVVTGLMNKQIASEVKLSEITVKIHRGQAMKKMAARSVADLVRKAEALGLGPGNLDNR
jgi:FixJ family two-component response regulator